MRLSYLIPFALVAVVSAADTLKSVQDAFNAANIPANLRITFNPSFLLGVSFPSGASVSSPGVQLSVAGKFHPLSHAHPHTYADAPTATAKEPSLFLTGASAADLGGPFVAIMVDPDAPTPQNPTIAQIRHLVAPDLAASAKSSQLTTATAPISAYIPPGPPAGSPAHRYIILLYKQPPGFKNQKLITPSTGVTNFDVGAFAAATGLGNPVAGNFFRVAPA
ncbi:hypothetical protein H0H81_000618 [Sphagnurus paluster]|uniref:PEBP-like protein n=1 Tax=Sphagnurus paluster TaxID=117069 RepID=A0A9P7K3D6_9AGAR|nr:hypothetical protein H0H81_000618 [Sphagnurus paluster]